MIKLIKKIKKQKNQWSKKKVHASWPFSLAPSAWAVLFFKKFLRSDLPKKIEKQI